MFCGHLKRICTLMLSWVFNKCQLDPICWWCFSVLLCYCWFSGLQVLSGFQRGMLSLQLQLHIYLFLLSVLSGFASFILKLYCSVHIKVCFRYDTVSPGKWGYFVYYSCRIKKVLCKKLWIIMSCRKKITMLVLKQRFLEKPACKVGSWLVSGN